MTRYLPWAEGFGEIWFFGGLRALCSSEKIRYPELCTSAQARLGFFFY
jgi:hypothetical protein